MATAKRQAHWGQLSLQSIRQILQIVEIVRHRSQKSETRGQVFPLPLPSDF
jgi:hypothetical protein